MASLLRSGSAKDSGSSRSGIKFIMVDKQQAEAHTAYLRFCQPAIAYLAVLASVVY